MREITDQELKLDMLEIMDVIHNFCVKQNIKYSLAYGTLLGAIRHNGYIPWDDNLDIIMFREDYEKFKLGFNQIKGCPFKLIDNEIDPGYINLAPKVIDTRTTMVDGIENSEKMGVWVDIFVIDYLKDDYSVSEKMMNKSLFYNLTIRSHYMSKTSKRPLHQRIIFGMMCFMEHFINREKVLKKIQNQFTNKNYQNYCGVIVQNFPSKKDVWETEWFDSYELHTFEDREYYIVQAYDALLRKNYNEYWVLPKEEQRVTHHSAKLYWK